MIRLLIFVLWIIFFAAALTALFAVRSAFPVEAFGWKMEIPAGLAFVIALFFAATVALATSLLKDIVSAPRAARARKAIELRESGLAAVTRGLEAIASGDGAAAKREADRAAKALAGAPVAKLIAAQAAQISGDDAAAGEALAGMLEAPETEFLALRGLFAKAMREDDFENARKYAERAFDRRAGARWAFDAVFELALEKNDYAAAQVALERAAKSKAIDQASADRAFAATKAAAAYASHLAGDDEAAIEEAIAGLKRAPGLAPAAILAARLLEARGDKKKAEKILSAAFSEAPSRAVSETFESLFADAAALERLADYNPHSREAELLRAKAALMRGDAGAAVEMLAATLRTSTSARALLMMASAQSAVKGEAAARSWLERAAAARDNDGPSADAFFRITGEGWRRLIREYRDHGRLSPPPLEAPAPGLSSDDLAISPPSPKSEEAVEDETISTGGNDAEISPEQAAAAARNVS